MHVGPPISQDLTTDIASPLRATRQGTIMQVLKNRCLSISPKFLEGFAESSPCGTTRHWYCPVTFSNLGANDRKCLHRDPHVGASGLRYYKEPNVPEGFAESSPCGSIRPWNCPVTLSNTALISHHTMTTEPRQDRKSVV